MGEIAQVGKSWCIDVTIEGRRIRRRFPTKKGAEEVLEHLLQHKSNQLKEELINACTSKTNKNARRPKSA